MPGLDGTGPMGRGTRTGRGLGNCGTPETEQVASQNVQNPQQQPVRLGRGACRCGQFLQRRRRGGGRGWGRLGR